MASDETACARCGHPRKAHEHYRAGTECSLCQEGECPEFKQSRWFDRFRSGRVR